MSDLSPVSIRMKQAMEWLKQNKGMLQKDIAEKMGITPVSFSRALGRINVKNDPDFLISFNEATGNYFSLDWLLEGKGDKMRDAELTQETTKSIGVGNSTTNEIERLRSENDALIKTINVMASELSAIRGEISELRKSICVTVPVRYTTQETDLSHLNEQREITVK